MKAVVITKQGAPVAPNVLVREMEAPVAGAGEAIVRTLASALNHLDLWVGRGLPGVETSFPHIGGSDGCGVVEAVGEGVDPAWIGRRVILNARLPQPDPIRPGISPVPPDILMIGEHMHGTMAERFRAPVANLLDVGDADPVEAAAFGLSFLTAWRMLVTRAGLRPGMIVLVTGIGGGVALACLAIAKYMGCRVIVTSRSGGKLERARALGADDGILDQGTDWSREVRAMTGRRGVDLCADSVGKAIHASVIRALARGGTCVTCGCTSGPDATTDLARIFWNQLSIIGSTMGDMDEFRQVTSLFRTGALRPVIDHVATPAEAQGAYARMETGAQFGKIVVRWADA
ncbi:MAG: zinc-binding dehydrogenase [Phycisphaeraceae bacterium]|nr:zinc-binding dehydrogenase [Phycisphaeraceae bacterium]